MTTLAAEAAVAGATLEDIAERIGTGVAGPFAGEVDRDARFPIEAIGALREACMLGALVPAQLGGGGATLGEAARAVEALGRHCASTALIYAMHSIQVACLARHGRSAWAREFLARVASEELLLASATTETGVGGDVRRSLCAVDVVDGRFALRKDAPVISYGAHADAILVTARRAPDSQPADQVLVVVPAGDATLTATSGWDTLGFRGTCSNGYLLEAVGLPEQILSDSYADISAQTMLPTSHVLWASAWLGLAGAATERARAYVRAEARKRPGTTPPSALRLAELVGIHEQLRALVHGSAQAYQQRLDRDDVDGMSFAISMNTLKTSASTLTIDIVGRALAICGMAGYREDSPFSLGRLLRDAHGAALMINNDRIHSATAQMLLVHKGEL